MALRDIWKRFKDPREWVTPDKAFALCLTILAVVIPFIFGGPSESVQETAMDQDKALDQALRATAASHTDQNGQGAKKAPMTDEKSRPSDAGRIRNIGHIPNRSETTEQYGHRVYDKSTPLWTESLPAPCSQDQDSNLLPLSTERITILIKEGNLQVSTTVLKNLRKILPHISFNTISHAEWNNLAFDFAQKLPFILQPGLYILRENRLVSPGCLRDALGIVATGLNIPVRTYPHPQRSLTSMGHEPTRTLILVPGIME